VRRRREKVIATLLALGLMATALSACGDEGEATASAAKAEAPPAEWKTWVLSSPNEIRVPLPPEAGSAALDQAERMFAAADASDQEALARWDRNPAPAPWIERAMEFVSQRPKDPPYSSRAYGYVSVAMYDAAVAAAHWREHYGGSTYPDSHAAIAGAASRVLAYLFPEQPAQRLDADADQAARFAVTSEENSPAGAVAGLELGREVASRVIASAKRDGLTTPWNGERPPLTPAYWAPPPGSAARPVQPMAGTWRTWVIGSPTPFRAPLPPRYGSPEFDRGVRTVIEAKERLTEEQRRAALFWAGGEGTALPAGIWEGVIIEYLRDRDLSLEEETRVFALASVAMADAGVASWDSKYHYWYPRPENAIRDSGSDPNWKPLIPTPFFPAYTSGHATYSAAVAEVLSYLFPEEADEWRRKAREAADARIWGGIHWPWDSEAGLAAGRKIGELVVERAKEDGANP
jgi:membrane-associated phospholipid phosphatase